MDEKVKNLLNIIKYTPLTITILISIFIIFLMYQEKKQDLKNEKYFSETQYLQTEKEALYSKIDTVNNYIKNEKAKSEKSLKEDLTFKINNVHKIATNMYLRNKDTLSKDEIIKQIKTALEAIRFDNGKGYFSIHTMKGMNILQPIVREYEGKSVLNRKDLKGNYTVQKAIEIAKTKGEGFLSWYSLKPNNKSTEFKKIGIVKKFEPYDLIITTGIFIDDYEENLKKRILNHLAKLEFKNKGFVSIINYDGDVILHKSKSILNHNVFKEKEFSHIKDFLKNLISTKDKESGDYFRYKPIVQLGKETNELKITYSRKFDDWKWIISTSFKLSDANKIIEKRKAIIEKKYDKKEKDLLIYSFLFIILLVIISFFIARLIEKKFLNYKENLENQILENKAQKETLLEAHKIAHMAGWKLEIKTKKVIWSNEFINIFGLNIKDEEIFGLEYLEKLMFKEDISTFRDSMKNCIVMGKEHNSTYRITKPNGEMIWINCIGHLNKEKTFVIGIVQDITAIKKLEAEKQQQSELLYQQSKMAAMGEMIGNIAHQWRQPLSTITTASTGTKLLNEMNTLSDSELNSALVTINNSAQYLSQTIDDFRGFFNPKNSVLHEFKIEDTLIKTLKLIDPQFNTKNIEIIKNIENYQLMSIENDLIQVLINILNNARDVLITKEKARRLIFINTYQKKNSSYIEIIDNAGGIEDNIIDRIFEAYFTTKDESQGTGIGLHMSKEIVIKHLKGTIKVTNETYNFEGVQYTGAKFTISID